MKQLKTYQEKAVEKLIKRSLELFEEKFDKKTIVFQAPTGSGKTFMMSQFIEEIIKETEEDEKDLCFLWFSIGKGDLHTQSYKSLKKEFAGFPKCVLLEEEFFGSRRSIDKNEVVVVNWEKLYTKDSKTGEWKNILMKDKETTNFRELIANTKDERKIIILIIDESHASSSSERALELRDIVNPDLTIEMSATPILTEGLYNEKVQVQPNDVIEEGMIKKEIIINEDLDIMDDNNIVETRHCLVSTENQKITMQQNSENLILEASYKKREYLTNLYKQNGINVNPLCLIQLPDSAEGEDKREAVESFLKNKGITYENGKLAVWMTGNENKINHEKETITPNNSEVEFLIFKTAIATGWDCPRAQILVRFREVKSISFEIQTVGRIIRMPQAFHYGDDNLNKAYVYVNTNNFDVKQEKFNPNIIKSIHVKRNDELYNNFKLNSYYRTRVDYGDITSSITSVLEEVFNNYFGISKELSFGMYDKNKEILKSKKVNTYGYDNQDEIILNMEIDIKEFDKLVDKKLDSGQSLNLLLSQNDLEYAFINLIKQNLNGFAFKRSTGPVQTAIFTWFQKYLGTRETQQYEAIYVMNVVLNNYKIFDELLDSAVKKYKPLKDLEVKRKMQEVEEWNENWEISKTRNFNPHTYKKENYSKYIYSPCYINLDNNLERDFSDFIEENNQNIAWWWQNGNEHMESNFGIKYGEFSTFQPDFLIDRIPRGSTSWVSL